MEWKDVALTAVGFLGIVFGWILSRTIGKGHARTTESVGEARQALRDIEKEQRELARTIREGQRTVTDTARILEEFTENQRRIKEILGIREKQSPDVERD